MRRQMNIRVTKRQKNNGLSVTDNFNNPGLDLIEELDGTFTIVGGNGSIMMSFQNFQTIRLLLDLKI